MTVAELIDKLSKVDQSLQVAFETEHGIYSIVDICATEFDVYITNY